MDSLAFALKAAVKVAGKDELAFVRLHRLNEDTLSVSALGNDVSFRAKLKVDFIHWNDDRDDRIEISKHAANSLAGYQVKTPEGLDVEPLVSIQIGDEKIRVEDATGLFQTAGGRDEHRLKDPILPGDHEKIFYDAASAPGTPFWINSRGHQHHRRRGQGAPPSNCHAQPFRTGRVRLPLVRPR